MEYVEIRESLENPNKFSNFLFVQLKLSHNQLITYHYHKKSKEKWISQQKISPRNDEKEIDNKGMAFDEK